MKFTVEWLKDYLDTDASTDEIVERLTMLGLEVESITDRSAGLEGFVTAHVLEAVQHPDADRLRVCSVDFGGDAPVQVVCGAPNARTGLKGVFAASGAYIPGTDITLKKAEIRGVESNGMLLSEREMGISDEHDGIIDLDEATPVGMRAVDIMGLGDTVIEIAITPNRGDCLGVRGIARDLAASGLGALKPLDNSAIAGTFKSPINVHLDFDDATSNACPYFMGRYIKGVKNGDSPQWMKDRLLAIGLRPISALVDITNYITFGLNRPLHVFDADKVSGDIHVRLGKQGESLAALNDKAYDIDETMTVVADEGKAEALGGIIGGIETGCTEGTVNVFLEAAYFDPIRTAVTGRKLSVISDARFRFERGVDPESLSDGIEIGTRLIQELCGGEASEPVSVGSAPQWQRTVDLRLERVKTLGGIDLPAEEVIRILDVLGFNVEQNGDVLTAHVPSWRSDIVGEACLVEEVVRVHGFDNIPIVPFTNENHLPHAALTADQRRRAIGRRTAASRGLTEAVTYSFLPRAQADLFGGVSDGLMLVNPISADLDAMRPSVLPNLIAAAGRNADRGMANAALFEVGPAFTGDKPGDQEQVIAGIRCGVTGVRNWAQPPRKVDAYDAKADAMAILGDMGAPVANLQVFVESPAWYHPGRSGELRLGPKTTLARFGEIHPRVLRAMDIKGPIVGFEILAENLPKPKASKGAARAILTLSSFQAVERDFAFVVDTAVTADKVMAAARGVDKTLITDVRLFDVFEGGNLGEDKKSVAINVVMQPTDKTLTDAEIDDVAGRIVEKVSASTGGTLRG
ncbi:MAG: phenylalanine--tRNA ligase subunit beta [Rhodospirillales bacterium]|jgi:phenylalanyl-tRNA synthetase beta chain|nr:phenylalanine--tRNA ligase subunit beta [Rhodospirillales bacterium]MBT4039109.1 phenylalanine--tRNA ligase subunit beta [Rhodospirillales bacterium]MBT4625510.1 phenylalanine--tRNA ligase subunit beta [Rhodospirillales bacterium]MBT5352148.1 phenylalanine--tRNA ligase subunit beta [Rhodospirillales bacterium]MBT5521917.1 phenylalanine--tRNA ligase subunit beta [Rhodospirillales bacterium]